MCFVHSSTCACQPGTPTAWQQQLQWRPTALAHLHKVGVCQERQIRDTPHNDNSLHSQAPSEATGQWFTSRLSSTCLGCSCGRCSRSSAPCSSKSTPPLGRPAGPSQWTTLPNRPAKSVSCLQFAFCPHGEPATPTFIRLSRVLCSPSEGCMPLYFLAGAFGPFAGHCDALRRTSLAGVPLLLFGRWDSGWLLHSVVALSGNCELHLVQGRRG